MPAETRITCPYCGEDNAPYDNVRSPFRKKEDKLGAFPKGATIGAIGTCGLCGNVAMLFFNPGVEEPFPNQGQLSTHPRYRLVATLPELFDPGVPQGVPEHVTKQIKSADGAFRKGDFAFAAAGFGMALDAALLEICAPIDVASKPLGGKISKAKEIGKISNEIADILEGANSGRIIGAHYAAETTEEDARLARELTVAALESMYSRPAAVRKLQTRLGEIKAQAKVRSEQAE